MIISKSEARMIFKIVIAVMIIPLIASKCQFAYRPISTPVSVKLLTPGTVTPLYIGVETDTPTLVLFPSNTMVPHTITFTYTPNQPTKYFSPTETPVPYYSKEPTYTPTETPVPYYSKEPTYTPTETLVPYYSKEPTYTPTDTQSPYEKLSVEVFITPDPPKCLGHSRAKVHIELIASGGNPDYTYLPAQGFSQTYPSNTIFLIYVIVISADGQVWAAEVPLPIADCEK